MREFDVKNGNWSAYVDRLQMYFIANKIQHHLKLPTLIALMGEEAYELLLTLASPKKPSTISYSEAVELLDTHFRQKPCVLSERFKFRKRSQLPGESVAEYAAELMKLSKNCDFEAHLEENLRDQIVFGLRSDGIRLKLFKAGNLDYKKTIELASALEAGEQITEPAEGTIGEEASASVSVTLQTISQQISAAEKSKQKPKKQASKNQRQGKVCKMRFAGSSNCKTPLQLTQRRRSTRIGQAADNRAKKEQKSLNRIQENRKIRPQGMKAKNRKKPKSQKINPAQVPAQQEPGAAPDASLNSASAQAPSSLPSAVPNPVEALSIPLHPLPIVLRPYNPFLKNTILKQLLGYNTNKNK
ncbi:uncharacterized protein LOC124635726 [Helicoverpa zea]|uniref:uncharacterized protein LOC124635726 n=1 Tax=Helicoverpa zea TaxID=7113 RepID=UPI001F56617B|nr:uncharacterized protein LOC124635726 [Helicoverpa zea]